ncbi:hypothetical protein GT354_46130, partial [Streptomyces sp. SID3343]|nr:hypothetical protein [Streptomyces sp. SID3343]
MALLTPREDPNPPLPHTAADGVRPTPRTVTADPTDPTPPGHSGSGRRIVLVSRDRQLDSLLALRRIAAHLGDLRPVAG